MKIRQFCELHLCTVPPCRLLCVSLDAENNEVASRVHNEVGKGQLFDVYRYPMKSCSLPARFLNFLCCHFFKVFVADSFVRSGGRGGF